MRVADYLLQQSEASEQHEPPEQQHEQPSSQPAEQLVQAHEQEQSEQQEHSRPEASAGLGVSAANAPYARAEEARTAAVTDRNFFMGIDSTATAIGWAQR